MKKSITIIFLSVFLSVFSSVQAPAAAPAWEFDKAHSRFGFGVKHIFSTVHGYFDAYSGTFLFDPDNLAESKIRFEISAKSIQTAINKRDNHLRSADFFDVKTYPLITFESRGIQHVEGQLYEAAGILTMKDVSKEIVLPVISILIFPPGKPAKKSRNDSKRLSNSFTSYSFNCTYISAKFLL